MLISSNRRTRPRSRVSACSSRPAAYSRILDHLFRHYKNSVYQICLRHLGPTGEAEDATMEIFECLARNIGKKRISHFHSWLAVISRHHCLNILERRARQGQFALFYARAGSLSETEQLERKLDLERKLEQLDAGIRQLKYNQRRCILRFYFERQSYKEIAAQLGLPARAVKSHIQNGKRNLRKYFSQLGP